MVRNLANWLSIFRIFDLIIIIYFLEYHNHTLAFIFFIAGVTSDILDGAVARKIKIVSNIGKLLDPLADKVFVIGILIAMIKILNIPYWMVIVMLFREFAVTGLRSIAALNHIVISANLWGKIKTSSQFIAIGVLTLGFYNIGVIMLFLAVVLTVISGVVYFWAYFKVHS